MRVIRYLSLLFLLLASRQTFAATLFLEGGLHIGGDTLVTVVFTDGETQDIKGGELLTGAIGMIGDLSESLEVRGSIGIKFDGILAENGDATFTRIPVELMFFTKGESVSFGLGLSYHLGPELSVSGPVIGGSFDIEFDDAMGAVAEVDFKFGTDNKVYIGIKATAIDYEIGSASLSGNSVGVVIGFRF